MDKIKPKKSLGQNFLKDQKALNKIVEAAELSQDDKVLEIGPGAGALSALLAKRAGKVIMVEKDEELAEELARNFKFQISNFPIPVRYGASKSISSDPILNFKNKAQINSIFNIQYSIFLMVKGDILEINLPLLIEQNDFFDYKVVANIPYYITGKIIRLLFEMKYSPKLVVLLVQREVAQRICASPGKMSILAVSVRCFGNPEIVSIVPRESFWPVPDVDSAILKIVPHRSSLFKNKQEREEFFRLVKIGFSSRRKTLANNLNAGLGIERERTEGALAKMNFSPKVRAQELSVENWLELGSRINHFNGAS